MGDATDNQSFGSLPRHLGDSIAKYLNESSVSYLRLATNSPVYLMSKLIWSSLGLFTTNVRLRRGFQYTRIGRRVAWRKAMKSIQATDTVLSLFQIVPEGVYGRSRVVFYIDATLKQLWQNYDINVDRTLQLEALRSEMEGYRRADLVITRTEWAAMSVIEDYGIATERVKVVTPGNNLPSGLTIEEFRNRDSIKGISILFIGKEWKRKGLDLVVNAVAATQGTESVCISIHVIGLSSSDVPESWRQYKWVYFYGFVNKELEWENFKDIVARCNLAVLMSRAEAAGIALREYAAMGLPVLASGVGGMTDILVPGASIVVEPSVDRLTEVLGNLIASPEVLTDMRRVLELTPVRAGWLDQARTISNLLDLR